MKKRNILILVIIGVLMIGMLGGCGDSASGSKSSSKSSSSASGKSSSTEEDMVISTKYGDIHYDGQWKDSVKTKESDKGGNAVVQFVAEIGGDDYPLFDVQIGSGDGDSVGKLKDDSGKSRKVYIKPHDLKDSNGLSSSEKNRFYAMKDSVNYLIDHLQ